MREHGLKDKALIFALTRSGLIKLIVTVIVLIICAMLLVENLSALGVWKARGTVIMGVNVLVLAMCHPTVYGVVHRITLADFWLFPRLDGEWDAEICSNWPRIRRTYEAARSKKEQFDAMSDPLGPAEETARITKAKVTIKSSLLTIEMRLEPENSKRNSTTRFVRPLWNRPQPPELTYVFKQIDPGPIAVTDDPEHFGAGLLHYDPVSKSLVGQYWTQRAERSGFNTAGRIALTRTGKA